MICPVEGREELGIVRLPSAKPIARLEEEGVPLSLGAELGNEGCETCGITSLVVEAKWKEVFGIMRLSSETLRFIQPGRARFMGDSRYRGTLDSTAREAREATSRRLQDRNELLSNVRNAKEREGLYPSARLVQSLGVLTKNLPLNSRVLWKTPFAPNFPMTKIMPFIIRPVNLSRWPAECRTARSDKHELVISASSRKLASPLHDSCQALETSPALVGSLLNSQLLQ